eukprot:scaffold5772_cov145-Skeletonema_menzelii.AAC.2
MLCWRPSQIRPHQVSYEIVEQWVVLKVIVAEDISFFTIRTDFNVSPEASNRHIAGGSTISFWVPTRISEWREAEIGFKIRVFLWSSVSEIGRKS